MKQRFLLFLLMMVIVVAPMSAYVFEVDGIYYDVNGTKASVTYASTSYGSYSGDVVIPAEVTYEGVNYTVTSIKEKAFYLSRELTGVTIPNTVTKINDAAFAGCTVLALVCIDDVTA